MKTQSVSGTRRWLPPATRPKGRRRLPGAALAMAAILLGQMLSLAAAAPAATAELPEIAAAELERVFGGCVSDCSGDDGGASGEPSEPTKVGSPYWEYAGRSLVSRPSVAGDLVWQRSNYTDQPWGPFEVTYQRKESFNWSLSGSVPSSVVTAHLGGAYERSKTVVESFTVPARTYYKFFVAYPYERWRNYYKKYQDYSDYSRDVIATGEATTYDQWTKTSLVQGPAY